MHEYNQSLKSNSTCAISIDLNRTWSEYHLLFNISISGKKAFTLLTNDSALACIDSSQLNGNELVNEKDFSSMIALLVVTYH